MKPLNTDSAKTLFKKITFQADTIKHG